MFFDCRLVAVSLVCITCSFFH